MPYNNLHDAGATPAGTVSQLLHIGTGTLAGGAVIRLGDGSSTILTLSTTGLTVGGNLTVTGALQGNTQLAGPLVFTGVQSLSGAGAVDQTLPVTLFTSTGASQALTLADGTHGQIKTIVHAVDGGSGILTPATKTGYTTVTFTAAGDTVTLMFLTTRGWVVIASRGVTIS